MVVERLVVFHINFASSLCDFIQRRLSDEEMTVLNNLWHLPVEKCQQQRADMRTIDVSVGHDDDFVVAQLLDIEVFATNARSHRLNERANFFG